MLSDDSTYSITSQVTDAETATYTHTLTVTGRLVGEYQCSVSNIRTPSGSSRSLTVGKGHPIQFSVVVVYVEKELHFVEKERLFKFINRKIAPIENMHHEYRHLFNHIAFIISTHTKTGTPHEKAPNTVQTEVNC